MEAGVVWLGLIAALLASAFFLISFTSSSQDFAKLRKFMIEEQIQGRGITDQNVLRAMGKIPRHLFVPEAHRSSAYEDRPLPIGEGQTISQPYIVALMTESLHLSGRENVLELGTGSGYQTAVLAENSREVYTVEIRGSLSRKAEETLKKLGYVNIRFKIGDGSLGWKEYAPYDAVIVTFAAEELPGGIAEQLTEGGRIVIPLGEEGRTQKLLLGTKRKGTLDMQKITDVLFVPMVRTH